MRPALGPLCFIIALFFNSIVVNAMYARFWRSLRAARLNNVREGMYVTIYVMNQGSFHGYLHNAPQSRGELPNVQNSLLVKLPGGRGLIAYLERLHIESTEHLQESRYYIDTGKFYVFSGALDRMEYEYDARVQLVLDYSPTKHSQVTLHSSMLYIEHDIPKWVDKRYNLRHLSNRQLIDSGKYLHSVSVPEALYSTGGDTNGRHYHYHIKEGCYVTLYIINDGAYRGYLSYERNLQHHVDYNLIVKVSETRTFFAEMKRFEIMNDEYLVENRYFIQIGKNFVVSTEFKPHNEPHENSVMLEMRYFVNPQTCITVYGGLQYYEGRIPAWTLENYRGLHRLASGSGASSSSSGK